MSVSKEIQCNTSHVVPACMSCSAYRSSIFKVVMRRVIGRNGLFGTPAIFVKIGGYRNLPVDERSICVSESLSLRIL